MVHVKRDLQEVLKAIKNTGGIKSQIAENLKVERHTVDSYLNRWVTARRAWADECKQNKDNAESVVTKNIRIAKEIQDEDNVVVDAKDAKWYLSRIYKEKYSERREVAGPDGGALVIEIVETDDWRKKSSD